MNYQRLLAILVVGMLLSGCAHKHYRTSIPDLKSADSQLKVFECVVDKSLQVDAKPPLCDVRKPPDTHAIQHRHYQAWENEKREGNDGKRVPGDYYLSFVEFDDQGWFADRKQMEALFALLKKLKNQNRETLIYVYAHGWKHNASSCDDNVVCFSRLLERTDLAEKQILVMREILGQVDAWANENPKICNKNLEQCRFIKMLEIMSDKDRIKKLADNVGKEKRAVVGVYIGWRGLPFGSFLNNASFWTRKEAAGRVGRGGVFELLTRLNDYRKSRRAVPVVPKKNISTPPNEVKTQLVITGHSFGGLVIYSALSHALMERAAKTTTDGTQYAVAESFGDFVMLVNPAFEGSLYEPLFHIATNRCYVPDQRPVTMIVTSEADDATGVLFPMGQTLGTLFQHSKSSEQKRSMHNAIGHNPRYQTHVLKPLIGDITPINGPKPEDKKNEEEKDEKTDEKPECDCPNLALTSNLSLEYMLGLITEALLEPEGYGDVSLTPVPLPSEPKTPVPPTPVSSPQYASNYPYLVVKTVKEVIADHNAIYNERFIRFAQLFFLNHIVDSKPWTVQSSSVKNCLSPVPSRTKDDLPSGQSCWKVVSNQRTPAKFNEDGSSCSSP